jgi:hypothetical protein
VDLSSMVTATKTFTRPESPEDPTIVEGSNLPMAEPQYSAPDLKIFTCSESSRLCSFQSRNDVSYLFIVDERMGTDLENVP